MCVISESCMVICVYIDACMSRLNKQDILSGVSSASASFCLHFSPYTIEMLSVLVFLLKWSPVLLLKAPPLPQHGKDIC